MSGGNSAVIGAESNIPMPEPALEAAHRRIRMILAAGLGGMILLMLAAGVDAVRVLRPFASRANSSGRTPRREPARWFRSGPSFFFPTLLSATI